MRAKYHDGIGKGRADAYEDYRRVLDRSDIDVVSIVTPDHWHVKIAIEALQAGKHVFCQKPLTLTLEENRLIRAACQKHPDLVFCIGTQQRSDRDRFLRAINMVQQGLLGRITKVTVGIDGSPTGGPFKPEIPPERLDWDMWLGPAPLVDYMTRRCHYEFRWWYEYSGGKFTDWGAHHVDIASWALGLDKQGTGPVEIDGTDAKHPVPMKDGYPTVDDQYNTSHDFNVISTIQRRPRIARHQPRRQRRSVRGGKGPPLREPRQDHRNADRGELGRRQVRRRPASCALPRQAVRRAQGELLPLHPRRRAAGFRRVLARADDEHVPPLGDRGPTGSHDHVGPAKRTNHRR